MLFQFDFFIEDRIESAYKEYGHAVVQKADFRRIEQFTVCQICAFGVVSAPSAAVGKGIRLYCLLAEKLGYILMGGLFVSSQIEKGIAVAGYGFPGGIWVHGFQLG